MPLNADFILGRTFPDQEIAITDRDVMFYALSIGLGHDPMDRHDLQFVFEKNLKVFPTMPVVIGHPGEWMSDPRTGITRRMVVHGAQRLRTSKPLPIGGGVIASNRVTALLDKGEGRGAILITERTLRDAGSGEVLAELESSAFLRADGGFGSTPGPAHAFKPPPERASDRTVTVQTAGNAALLYRLNNDRNPLHADPDVAILGKFERPILHGLATYGLAAAAVAREFRERTIARFECHFSKPVFPGDAVAVDMWEAGSAVHFRARVGDAVVLDRGLATLA
jgi:acyl dehydratase